MYNKAQDFQCELVIKKLSLAFIVTSHMMNVRALGNCQLLRPSLVPLEAPWGRLHQ